jgi:hypothetical protein
MDGKTILYTHRGPDDAIWNRKYIVGAHFLGFEFQTDLNNFGSKLEAYSKITVTNASAGKELSSVLMISISFVQS